MEIVDLMNFAAQGYEKRQVNVFYQNDFFKARVIILEVGGKIPECQMDTYVMFYVVKGEVLLRKNDETSVLKENQVFITEPALLSMESKNRCKIDGCPDEKQNDMTNTLLTEEVLSIEVRNVAGERSFC